MSMSVENLAAPAISGEAFPGSALPDVLRLAASAESHWRSRLDFALTRDAPAYSWSCCCTRHPLGIALGGETAGPIRYRPLVGVGVGTGADGSGLLRTQRVVRTGSRCTSWTRTDLTALCLLAVFRLGPARSNFGAGFIAHWACVVLLGVGGCAGDAANRPRSLLAHYRLRLHDLAQATYAPGRRRRRGLGRDRPLIADAAVDGRVGVWGVVLFAMVFLWQPPHFWAIVLSRREEYEAAGFPMLPSVVGAAATRRQMLLWALALVPVSLLPCAAGTIGPLYAATAVVGGGLFVASILHAMRLRTREADRRVFRVSIPYLALLFAALLVECLPA